MLTDKHISYLTSLNGGGWSSTEKKKRLYELVKQASETFPKGDLISIELGVFAGVSLFCMAQAHKDIERGYVIGIETWDNVAPLEGTNSKENNDWWANLDMKYIKNEFFKSCDFLDIHPAIINGKSYESARYIAEDSIALLHQDGTHNEEVITKELEAWAPKVKVGGFWVCDDTNWSEAAAGYAKLPDYGFELVEQFDTWAIYKKAK